MRSITIPMQYDPTNYTYLTVGGPEFKLCADKAAWFLPKSTTLPYRIKLRVSTQVFKGATKAQLKSYTLWGGHRRYLAGFVYYPDLYGSSQFVPLWLGAIKVITEALGIKAREGYIPFWFKVAADRSCRRRTIKL